MAQGRAHTAWSTEEDAVLRRNLQKGAKWIHSRMPWRTVKAIRERAKHLGLSWKEPGRLDDMCPVCHERRITKGSHAARFGICTTCYLREEERRFRQLTDEERAKASKEAARQRYYRSRKHA